MGTDLNRFVEAQAGVYAQVLAELADGRKRSHWMWFVFPQLTALGRSATAQRFGLDGLADAQAYWRDPLLGPRLAQCVRLVLAQAPKTAHAIFGSPDDLKLCSCLTLFEAATAEPCFAAALDQFYGGRRDALTLTLLAAAEGR